MSLALNDDSKYKYNLLKNVSRLLEQPCAEGKSYLTRGNYSYFHYSCDDVNDAVRPFKVFLIKIIILKMQSRFC